MKNKIQDTNERRARFRQPRRICKSVTKELLAKENVFSVGVGFKYVNGKKTDEICINCSVTKKIDISKLKQTDLIPKQFNGISTDVTQGSIPVINEYKIETGGSWRHVRNIRINIGDSWKLVSKVKLNVGDNWKDIVNLDTKATHRPCPGGVSLGVDGGGTAGTLGCALYYNGDTFGLSNAHVIPYMCGIADDAGARCHNYDDTWQPSAYDGGIALDNPIGYLYDYGTISKDADVYTDWAIFSAGNNVERHKILGIDLPENLHYTADDVFPDDPVIKSGRTSGVTTGTVLEIDVSANVSYKNCYGSAYVVTVRDLIRTTLMLQGGDSGSVLLHNRQDKQVAGLCFASGTYSYAIDFNHVLNEVNGIPRPIRIHEGLHNDIGNPAIIEGAFDPVGCTGLTKANGILKIDLTADHPEILSSDGGIDITSSGQANINDWRVLVPYTEIPTYPNWETFEIPLVDAATVGGELNVSAINYFRWYNYTTDGDVRIFSRLATILQSKPWNIYF